MQIIADNNDNFNFDLFFKIKKVLKDNMNMLYENLDSNIEEKLIDIGISKELILLLKDDIIKKKFNMLYSKIKVLNFDFITINDYQCIFKYKALKFEVPFCIIISKALDLNNKNILLFYEDYFSKGAIYTLRFFSKVINQNGVNVFSKYEYENITNYEINNFEKITDNMLKGISQKIILSNKKYIYFFLLLFIDYFIIIEARNENNIHNLIDLFIESGKEIYVVPSNIFNKNSYFSNYLIKQGADIILNANDIKLLLKRNSR